MKFSKMTTLMMAAGLSAVVALAGCGGSGGAKQQYLNIGTGGTAGTYYPLGGAMAELFNKNIANVNASAQSTGASVANVNMLKDGSLDLALIQNDIAYYAANGLEMFDGKKVDNLRGIATLYPETVQIVALEKSGIKSINDLRGKRVAVGAAGSGTAVADQLLQKYPYYTKISIPAGTYNGVAGDTLAVSVRAMIATTSKLSDEMGFNVTKAIYTNLDKMAAAHAVGKMITKDAAQDGMSIPMNAGAEKFFKEK